MTSIRPASSRSPYRVLQIAFGISLVGNGVGTVAYPLFVLEVTGSTAVTGAVVTVAVVASVVTGLVMGPLLDRWGMRRSWLVSMLVGSGVTAATLALHLTGLLPTWLLLALTFVRSAADEPGRVAVFGLLPRFAEGAGRTLERANATVRAMSSTATVVGPIGAGLVVAVAGSTWTLVVDAAGGALAALVIGSLMASPSLDPGGDAPVDQTYMDGIRASLRFLRYDRVLGALIAATAVFATLDSGLATIGLTAFSAEVLGAPAWYGGLVASFGAGTLVGTMVYGVVGHRLPRLAVYLTGYIALAVTVALLPFVHGPVPAIVLMFVGGVAISPVDMLYMMVLQERVPARMFGGVAGIATTVITAPGPVGVSLITWMVVSSGSIYTFVVLGLCYLGIALSLLFVRPLRGIQPDPRPDGPG